MFSRSYSLIHVGLDDQNQNSGIMPTCVQHMWQRTFIFLRNGTRKVTAKNATILVSVYVNTLDALTFPWRASAASGAGSGTSGRCARACGRRASRPCHVTPPPTPALSRRTPGTRPPPPPWRYAAACNSNTA